MWYKITTHFPIKNLKNNSSLVCMNIHIKSFSHWAGLEDMICETWHWAPLIEMAPVLTSFELCTQSQFHNLVTNFLRELQASEILLIGLENLQ